MTPAQFKKALDRLGTTQAAFARLVGVTPRHANRWAAGDADIPRSVELILTLWACGKISQADLE
jgi:DNA-binding transcriptional regulator YdaS (Cro superfamily)